MKKLRELQAATLRARTVNPAIGVATEAGQYQIQQITFDAAGVSDIKPVSEWVDYKTCLAHLNQIGGGAQ